MRVAYLLPEPELGGGTKVVFQHAELLRAAGHQVTVVARGPRPGWCPFDGEYVDCLRRSPDRALASSQDLVVATYWETIEPALALSIGPVVHFCQGYEGDLEHLEEERPSIERAYSHSLPAFVVSPHLGEMIEARFGRPSRLVPPPVDPLFDARWRWRPRRRPWIAVPGVFEAAVKDVATALDAVRELEAEGWDCRVLRISVRETTKEELALRRPDRLLCRVPPSEVAAALRECDLLFFSSRPSEGFGLPLLEAMVSGVPAIASDIPSTRFFAADAAALVPPGDSRAFAAAAEEVLVRPRRWRQRRRAGCRVVERFRAERVTEDLCAAVDWARRQVG